MGDEPEPETIDEAAVVRHIMTFEHVHVVEAQQAYFFFFGPMEGDNLFPFATLVTDDSHDQASDLQREGVFRLNIGLSKERFLELFGARSPRPGADGIIDAGHDYTRLDTLMPHPVYGNMYWVCVLNPSPATFEQLHPLLTEAHAAAVAQAERRAGR